MITKKFSKFSDEMIAIGKKVGATRKKKLLCLTTGEQFNSASEAALHFKIAVSNLSKAIIVERPIKNLYFKYV